MEDKEDENRKQSSLITELNKKYIALVAETSSIRTETEMEKAERIKLEEMIKEQKNCFEKRMKMQAMCQSGVQKKCNDLEKRNKDLESILTKSDFEIAKLTSQVNMLESDLIREKVKLEESEERCSNLSCENDSISSLFQGKVRKKLTFDRF